MTTTLQPAPYRQSLLERIDTIAERDWTHCPGCSAALHRQQLRRVHGVCPHCAHHFRLSARERVEHLVDQGTFVERDAAMVTGDPLGFVDAVPYVERLAAATARCDGSEAARYGCAAIGDVPVVVCVLDFGFMGGSMGAVVGEKITRAAELAAARRCPLVTCSTSGGARMQEGVLALLQMAKTADALNQLAAAGQAHVSVLADPVYGGVMASFASLADVIIAERGARAGFAGPRVIEQTIRQQLPAGFQTAEFLLEHGHIDAVVPRSELRQLVGSVLGFHAAAGAGLRPPATGAPATRIPARSEVTPAGRPRPDAWETVALARHRDRPQVPDYLPMVLDSFVELRGDRWREDDPSIIGGLGMLAGMAVMVIGHRKGRGTAEAVAHNFGMPHPAGYRKAQRLMKYAERFGVAVVTLVDTPGAYPGLRAEEENQSQAIAACIQTLCRLTVPVVAVITGEGGSGGALALAVCDRMLMLEHSTFSVISPEGCASILFGDAGRAPQAARSLRLTGPDLRAFGIVDQLLPEPGGGAHEDPATAGATVRAALLDHLADLWQYLPDTLAKQRRIRIRGAGTATLRGDGLVDGLVDGLSDGLSDGLLEDVPR